MVIAARQQYLDVLASDPANKRALHGMMVLTTDTKQFQEAYDWTQKAIAADSTGAGAYYTAGFLDWSMTYPDYATARKAAGMQPQDSGVIPDAGLRQGVRAQHLAQIEDGHRMLQTALQLDPNYSNAMAYMNLLYRIEAGIADTPAEAAELTAKADDWVSKALEARRKQAQANMAADRAPNANRSDEPLPPAPPPPPPPGRLAQVGDGKTIHVDGNVQQAMILRQTAPIYPAELRQAGVTGTVSLAVVVGKDGKVQNIRVLSGQPMALAMAAIETVKQWVYKPTLLNGDPVDVATTVNVTFGQ